MGENVDIIDYYLVLLKYKFFIFTLVTVAVVAAVVISGRIPKTYLSEAKLLTQGSSSPSAGLSALLSGGILGGGGFNPLAPSPSNRLVVLLQSRSLAERVIRKYDLLPQLNPDLWDPIKKDWKTTVQEERPTVELSAYTLMEMLKVEDNMRFGTIHLSVESRAARLSFDVLNYYITEIKRFINENDFDEAKRSRIFIEKRLTQNRKDFIAAGKALTEYYETNRISPATAKLNVNIGIDSPTLQTDPSIDDLKDQEKQLEEAKASTHIEAVPQKVYWEYLASHREILAKLNAVLTQQYELAKIEEAKESISFQVIESPLIPLHKYKPSRTKIVLSSFVGSVLAAIFLAYFCEFAGASLRQHQSPKKVAA